MKYTRPEVEIMELDKIDIIQTSGDGDIEIGDNGTPGTGFSMNGRKEVPTNVPTI